MTANHEDVGSSPTRISSSHGYSMIRDPEHPLAMANGYVYEHRLVAAEIFGVEALEGNHVHHKDGNRKNNDPDNLELLSASDHGAEHAPDPAMLTCHECGRIVRKRKRRRYCSKKCGDTASQVIEWPGGSVVQSMVDDIGYSATGRLLGVSDNAVRKYLKRTLPG